MQSSRVQVPSLALSSHNAPAPRRDFVFNGEIASSAFHLLAMTVNDVILTPQAEGSFLTSSFLADGPSSQADGLVYWRWHNTDQAIQDSSFPSE
ncbi:MAG: hypothetical protein KGY46_08200 [Anaerolineales bacterium]|nr:hypothetical protein [Anaerolineales bacterium]